MATTPRRPMVQPLPAATTRPRSRATRTVVCRFLTELVGRGRALEFAIGTGRIALRLAEQDIEVAGIELSPHMVDQGSWIKEHDYVRPRWVGAGGVGINVCHYDPVTQVLEENHVRLSPQGVRSGGAYRLAWPSELDLMARIAGLRLTERWGGWHKEPFTADSTKHLSVYRHS